MASKVATKCKYQDIYDGHLVCFCGNCDCFLGEGTYGKVYKATRYGDGSTVAIKYPISVGQIEYEIRTIAEVMHPNILKYYDDIKYGPYEQFVEHI